MSNSSARPIVSPRAIEEITAVWEKYEAIKALPHIKKDNSQNIHNSISEILNLLSGKEFGDILNRNNISGTSVRISGKDGHYTGITIEVL